MATTLVIAGAAVAALAVGARVGMRAFGRYKAMPKGSTMKKHHLGGFKSEMDKSEAALILGVRRSASIKKIKEKHRKLMLANHPDAGGSPLIATKVNEAKDLLLKEYKD